MDEKLPVLEIAAEAWRLGARAFVPNLPWLGLLMVLAGLYRLVLGMEVNGAVIIALNLMAAVFFVGVAFSLSIYRAMLGARTGKFLQLVHANLALYLAVLFVGVFIAFFLAILPGILLEASGRTDLGAETAPAVVQAAFMDMLPTAYGAVFLIACALGLWALCFLAVRLLLVGAATVSRGETMVFRTWPWTKRHAFRLSLAALVTHVAPFGSAVAINAGLNPVLGTSAAGHFIGGALGILMLAPFILAGHGLAMAVLPRLMPDPDEASEIASVE
ncbi:hypothetical protein [Hyphomonas sp.]|jgi:hypothetical protein|uniref:hypothetical protein n=1 Tax=Hyphomonas sp. TaxID=87 RepID=UPI0039E46862